MSKVTPIVNNHGGKIHLNYAPGSSTGTSNTVTLPVKVVVDPTGDIPDVLIRLKLPEGHFRFENNTFTHTEKAGKMANDESVIVEFKIICDIVDPSDKMALTVVTSDEFDIPEQEEFITYDIEK